MLVGAWRLPEKDAAELRKLVDARFEGACRDLLQQHERLGGTEAENARVLNTRYCHASENLGQETPFLTHLWTSEAISGACDRRQLLLIGGKARMGRDLSVRMPMANVQGVQTCLHVMEGQAADGQLA